METFISLIGFVGAWLLFAGPIYQAALELIDEDLERDRIRLVTQNIPTPKRISLLWWFLPPVKVYLEQQRSRKYRETYMKALLPEDAEALIGFMNKAMAWLLVAIGGLLLAVTETYNLIKNEHIHLIWFWIVVFFAGFFSVLFTFVRIRQTKYLVENANG